MSHNVHVSLSNWGRTTKTVEGVEVYLVGRVEERKNTFAVSVPPRGVTRYFCSVHRTLFGIGLQCPECTVGNDDTTPAVTLITPPASDDLAEKVS